MPRRKDQPTFLARSIKRTRKELTKLDLLMEGDHILTLRCPGCGVQFQIGEEITLVPIGPGSNVDARARAREGRPYNAAAVPVHWTCATGEENHGHPDDPQAS
jgi:hypothetical protein